MLSKAQVLAAVDLELDNTLNINPINITGLKHNVNVSVADGDNFSLIFRNCPSDENIPAESIAKSNNSFSVRAGTNVEFCGNIKIFDIEHCSHNKNKHHFCRLYAINVSASSPTLLLLCKLCIFALVSRFMELLITLLATNRNQESNDDCKKQNTRNGNKEQFMLQKNTFGSNYLLTESGASQLLVNSFVFYDTHFEFRISELPAFQ